MHRHKINLFVGNFLLELTGPVTNNIKIFTTCAPMTVNRQSKFEAQLIPFQRNTKLPIEIHCMGSITRENEIKIRFSLTGNLQHIKFDSIMAGGKRTDNLWQKTCFELFIKTVGSLNYWEYNLSPSCNWAIYGFADYRDGKFDELSVDTLPISVNVQANVLSLESYLPLPQPLIGQKLKIGLSSVVQDKNGDIYYYALKHLKEQADFHDENSFLIDVQA